VTDLCASSRPRDGRRETGCRREKAEKKEGWKAEEQNPGGEKGIPTANCNGSAASRRARICGRDTSSASGANAWPSSSMAMAHRNKVIVGRQSRTKNSWQLDKALPGRSLLALILLQLDVQSAAADHDVLRLIPHRVLDCPTPDQPYQSAMTDQQFQLLLRRLQAIIAILGLMAGVLIAPAWTYLWLISRTRCTANLDCVSGNRAACLGRSAAQMRGLFLASFGGCLSGISRPTR
jgi:hypothetical protein